MKYSISGIIIGLVSLLSSVSAGEWIRINQLGYLPESPKVAVFMSEGKAAVEEYVLVEVFTGEIVKWFDNPKKANTWGRMQSVYRLDFSDFKTEGTYVLRVGETMSPRFVIGNRVYDGTADFILRYMRQQRCGFNPFERDSCHIHDGYIVYHPTRNGKRIDVRGGWHDASDQLQYVTTSANATYQMMFAYLKNPEVYGDVYDAYGLPGANGIPDIVDEIKWGLDWLNRMNPSKGEMYNQIADDRDHKGFKLPSQDHIDYGWGKGTGRPVYYCSGKPQVRGEFSNATTGVASTAGKYASCFALGAEILKDFYPDMADILLVKAREAYWHGANNPGVCQTASVVSPYIYEECNWTDDMELAAVQLYVSTGETSFLQEAVEYGRFEPVTPWMGADSARHYQWYPFINLGHYHLASVSDSRISKEFGRNLRSGIERVYERAQGNPFLNGIPAIWCSNNLTVAMATQCRLYRELTGDNRYREMESSLIDWLFGCNPWGTSMITELPLWGDYPVDPHTPLVALGVGLGALASWLVLARLRTGYKMATFIGFVLVVSYLIIMYFLISPDTNIEKLYLPVVLRNMGNTMIYIVLTTYLSQIIPFRHFFQSLCAVGFVREGIGGPIATAVVSRLFKITVQSNYYTLGGVLDSLNPVTVRLPFSIYFGELQRQVILVSVKEVFGYAVLAGILLLIFILFARYTKVVHRIKVFRVPVVGRLFAMGFSKEGRKEDTIR